MAKTIHLKVTSAFLVDGQIAKIGDVVEVNQTDAKDLLHRGKAVLAVAAAPQDVTLTDEGKNDGSLTDEGTSDGEQPAERAEQPAEQPKTKGKGKK